ncbi:MAG: hypothetical protein RI958_876 [Actinomycetota bacterium]
MTGPRHRRARFVLGCALAVVGVGAGACGSEDGPVTLRLVTYDSFPTEDTPLNEVLADFTAETGIEVEVVVAGDAGTMISKAVLTAGNPEGDVLWGVDNTLLSRAIDGDVFEPYRSSEIAALDPALVALAPDDLVTPVDFGDVCINYDIEWFTEAALEPPSSLDDLLDPAYRDLLVVENPASSSPGLAFLLATIAHAGEDGWQAYWQGLLDNGVSVVDSWTTAYYESFSGSSGAGPRPLVVSYASSPPAEVIFADPPREDAPTAVMAESCFRQVEFAGILRGTEHPDEARRLIDHLVGPDFQAEVALTLFVWPARTDVDLPDEFTRYTTVPDEALTIDPRTISDRRDTWVDEWTELVLR